MSPAALRCFEDHARNAARPLRESPACADSGEQLHEHVDRSADVEGDEQVADRDIVPARHERQLVREGRASGVREKSRVVDVVHDVAR